MIVCHRATEADALLCGHVCALVEPASSTSEPGGPERASRAMREAFEPVRAVLAEAEFEPIVSLARRVRERYLPPNPNLNPKPAEPRGAGGDARARA